MKLQILKPASLFILIASCSNPAENSFQKAVESINAENLASHVAVLGSDEYEGRKPFSKGEDKTVNYLAAQMERIGLEPGFGDSYFQDVEMAEITSFMDKPAIVKSDNKDLLLFFPDDIAIISKKTSDIIEIENSEMIFAGFGIVAPEYNWDDYENIDVKGKTVVVFVNDPGLYTDDENLFKGKTMTYYGRWTYKIEEAERQGAKGILIIHETLGAGYPYDIPRKSALNSNFYLAEDANAESNLMFNGWVSAKTGENFFESFGMNVDSLRTLSCTKDFAGFPLNSNISLKISNIWEYNTSRNVVGLIRGNKKPEECIVYSAHWDHFGIGEAENGDSIYNGAVDNGTSLAWMLEIAEAYKKLGIPPARSIVIMAPTAEEQGLLGSKWYTQHPVIPVEKTLACINNDMLLPIGRMKDVMVTGFGQSELDNLVEEVALKQDRYIYPDPNPHTGMYFRSDHFSFAQQGVPSLFIRGNCDSREFGKEWAAEQEKDYINNRYHRPADNYYPETWDFSGIVEDAQMAFEIGYRLCNLKEFPKWNESSEFKSLRD
ncbi:MAG: M28 family peptidase [Bacteroidales bacterium]|nr:M28 family peptidase [Bacteroidales bacterium]MCF8391079.1 M28 family peptidase [Bacteroidales bacterium]